MHLIPRRTLLPVVLCMFALGARGQLSVGTSMSPQQLVQNVLLGPGVTAFNFSFNGLPAPPTPQPGTGNFTTFVSNLGLPAGLILSTGNVADIDQSGTQFASTDNGNANGDPDLQLLSGQVIQDLTIIEFDFIPTGDSVKFNYVFGSEEYPGFVCTQFNDAFGFFLSGPGITGPYTNNAANIALVPGTTLPVTIGNLNNGNPNQTNCPPTNAQYYVDNGVGTTVVLNAFTTVLRAEAQVICGQTYHIKLAIGDAVDAFYDSAVFLEAGSFQSNQVALIGGVVAGGIDSVFYEGCGTALFHLVRGAPLDQDTVEVLVAGTATEGVDYTNVPASVIFATGQDSALISIDAILDGVPEGSETIDLMVINEGPCGTDTAIAEIIIEEAPLIIITLSPDTTLICGDSAWVQATVTGGFGNYVLDWDQGIPDGQYGGWVNPAQTTVYTLTVTDDCGVITEAESVTIIRSIPAPLVVQAVPDITVYCPETPVQLQAVVQGGEPPYQYSWSNGLGFNATAQVAPALTASYSVTVTDRCGTDTSDVVTVTVDHDSIRVEIVPDTFICIGDTAVLRAVAVDGWGGYTYLWNTGGTADTLAVWPTANTRYSVIVMDGCGITDEDTAGVGVNAPQADFWWGGSTQVNNFPIPFIDNSFGATSWSWDFGAPGLTSTEQNPYFTYPEPGLYSVTLAIMDPLGCVDTLVRAIEVEQEFNLYIPNAFSPDGDGVNDLFRAEGTGIREFTMRVYDRWGELVFETEDITKAWDGAFKGGLATPGVYVVQVRVKAMIGEAYDRMGHVTLVR
ncbi:MAG: choice-of-anchor L domain-containing protein [Flavobacteriales bacterium]|nr:choice-of-anchor L domain-containing protein [Flavobacteriales bacterium]